MSKLSRSVSVKAFGISLLFFLSSVGASILISPAGASPNSPAALAGTPFKQAEANWIGDGNQFNQNYNPQNIINSSNGQYLGISWLFPLPSYPATLLSITRGYPGVDTTPMIINGTIYAITQFDQVFALNAANGNVLWSDILPVLPNSTVGHGTGAVSLHLHDGDQQFTTKLFGNTPTLWYAADDQKVYAVNALNGKYELNFSVFSGVNSVAGNNPGSVYHSLGAANILVDQNKGILISSMISTNQADSGRCFFRGWNILVSPPQLIWTAFCSPPQPGSNIPVDPNWDINQVNSMKGAEIFYPGPSANGGGYIPGTAAVNLKTLSPAQLNSTLYNDWGYANQSPSCAANTGGSSTGSTAAGWGAPWLLGTGPTAGLAFFPTNNKNPYNSPCTPGPDLWSAAMMAINETNGQWVWGFQASAHELWDYDCSWWQAMGNQTINGVNTQVIWKTCKAGYLFELNAQTGNLIWAWTAPQSIIPRCQYCYMYDPLNSTQMSFPYFNPNGIGKGQGTLMYPSALGAFENEGTYSPALNYIFVDEENVPLLAYYVAPNSTNYRTNGGLAFVPPSGATSFYGTFDNNTVFAINAATGQTVWNHFIPTQGYRGGLTNSGNIVYVTLSSGDLLMLNAKTGDLIRDFYIGGPLNVLPSVGATQGGQMELIVPITAGLETWATSVPGDLIALTLQNLPAATTNTVTTSVTVSAPASTTTITASAASTGFDASTVYGIAAVAVVFIIATAFFALRGRKPGS